MRNSYSPYCFPLKSGENLRDGIRRGVKQQLKRKMDKYRKARNKQKKDEDAMPMTRLDEIDDNCADDIRLPPEAIIFLMYKDHPVFNLGVAKKGLKKRAKREEGENDEDSDDDIKPDVAISSFSSRKKQREGQKKNWREERTYNKNDLAVKKVMIAQDQAAAMTRQVEVQEQQVKLDFLLKAKTVVGLSDKDLKPMYLQELKKLCSGNKNGNQDRKIPAGKNKEDVEVIELDLDERTIDVMTKQDIYEKYDKNEKGFDWRKYDGFCKETGTAWVYTDDRDMAKNIPDMFRYAPAEEVKQLKVDALQEYQENKDFSAYTKEEYEKFGLPEGSWKGISYVHFGMCCAGGHCKMSDRIVDTRFKCVKCGEHAHEECYKFVPCVGGSAMRCLRCIKLHGRV